MTKKNIPQQINDCQADSTREIDIFPGTDLKHLLAAGLLRMPTENAIDLLKVVGYSFKIPLLECAFSTIGEIAEFYNVNDGYISRILQKYGVVRRIGTDYVLSGTQMNNILRQICTQVAPGRRHEVRGGSGSYVFLDRANGCRQASAVKLSPKKLYYSPQIVLLLPVLMYWGTYLDPDSVGKKVLRAIERTAYYDQAVTDFCRLNKKREEPQRVSAPEVSPPAAEKEQSEVEKSLMAFQPDGNVAAFWKLVKATQSGCTEDIIKATVEALKGILGRARIVVEPKPEPEPDPKPEPEPSAVAPKGGAQGSRSNRGGFQPKYKKPENWDETVSEYFKRRINGRELAERTGIHYASLYHFLRRWNPGQERVPQAEGGKR